MRSIYSSDLPIEKYPVEETPPIFLPERPSDLPEKTIEEEIAEREAAGEVIMHQVDLSHAPPILPEEEHPSSSGGGLAPLALLGVALFFL